MKTKSEHISAKFLNRILKIADAWRKWWIFEDRSATYSRYVSNEPQKERHLQTAGTTFSQNGNALIYVLIAIALFAALSFTFARQNRNESTDQVTQAKAEAFSMQLIAYVAQTKSVIDQMMITGSALNKLDFTLPSADNFNTPPLIHKIYHPSGGGLSPFILPKEIAASGLTPPASVYLGLFNNIEWTPSSANDILLAAYGIARETCESLNDKITGKTTIPQVSGDLKEYFIDGAYHSGNLDFDSTACPDCKDQLTLCVSDTAGKTFVYYTVITPR